MTAVLNESKLLVPLVAKGESYESAGIIWNGLLHPRDDWGRFKAKGKGVFYLLKDLGHASYKDSTVFEGMPGHQSGHPVLPAHLKIGGTIISPPEFKGYKYSEHHIDWALKPGEKVYAAYGGPHNGNGQTGVVVHHANGSATVLLPTPANEVPKIGMQHTHFSQMYDELTKGGYIIDTNHPLDENIQQTAAKYDETVAELKKAKDIGAAPESAYGGKHVTDVIHEQTGEKLGHVEKTPTGKFTSHDTQGNKIGNISKHLDTAIAKVKTGKLTTPESYKHKKATKPETPTNELKPGDSPTSVAQMDDLPAGSKIKTGAGTVYTKNGDGTWKSNNTYHDYSADAFKAGFKGQGVTVEHVASAKSESQHPALDKILPGVQEEIPQWEQDLLQSETPHNTHLQNINNDAGEHIGNIEKTPDGKYVAYDAGGNKIGNINKHLQSAIDKIHEHAKTKQFVSKKEAAISHDELKKVGTKGYMAKVSGTTNEYVVFDTEKNQLPGKYSGFNSAWLTLKQHSDSVAAGKEGFVPVTTSDGYELGHIKINDNGKWESIASGGKLGYAVTDKQKAIDKLYETAGITPPVSSEQPAGEILQHTENGYTFSLKPGEKLYSIPTGKLIVLDANNEFVSVHSPSSGQNYTNNIAMSSQKYWAEKALSDAATLVASNGGTEAKAGAEPKKYAYTISSTGTKLSLDPGDVVAAPKDWNFPTAIFGNDGTLKAVVTSGGQTKYPYTEYMAASTVKEWESLYKNNNLTVQHSAPIESVFYKHPYGGTSTPVELKPGDKVWAYKDTGWGFWIERGDGSGWDGYTDNGKKVTSNSKMVLGSGWTVVQTGSQKSPVKEPKPTWSVSPSGDSITIGNKPFELEPGQQAWHVPSHDSIYIVSADPNNTKSMAYEASSGSPQSWLSGYYDESYFKNITGSTKIAEKAFVDEPPVTVEKSVSPLENFSYPDSKSEALNWDTYSVKYSLNAAWAIDNLGTKDASDAIKRHIATIQYHKENLDYSSSEKIAANKTLKALKSALDLNDLVAQINTAKDDKTLAALRDKTDLVSVESQQHASPINYLLEVRIGEARQKIETKKFALKTKDVGFDVLNGSPEQFANYAKQEGASFVGGMTHDDLKSWVWTHLGKPNHYASKQDIEAKAKSVVAYQKLAAAGEQALAKEQALAPTKQEQAAAKAVDKAADHEFKQMQSMYQSYKGTHSDMVYYSGGGTWNYTDGKGNKEALTLDQAKQKIDEGLMVPLLTSSKLSDPAGNNALTLKEQYDIPTSEPLYNYLTKITDDAGTGSSSFDSSHQLRHVLYTLTGDKLGLVNNKISAIEADPEYTTDEKATVIAALHASEIGGNDNQGYHLKQALANWLTTQGWWNNADDPFDKNTFNHVDKQQALKELGLDAAWQQWAGESAGAPVNYLFNNWYNDHVKTGLPEPGSAPAHQEPVKFEHHHGIFEATPEWLVAQNEKDPKWIYGVNTVTGETFGTHENSLAKGKVTSGDPITDFEFIHSLSDWNDVTPKWANTPGKTASLGTNKPASIDQEAWNVVAGAEQDPKAVDELAGSLFSDTEQLVSYLSNYGSYTSGLSSSDIPQILAGAPESIKKLTAWAGYTAYNNNAADTTKKANDISKAIKHKLKTNAWTSIETEKWKVPGTSTVLTLPPGADIYAAKDKGSDDSLYIISDNLSYQLYDQGTGGISSIYGAFGKQLAHNSDYQNIYTSPKNLTIEKAHSEGKTFTANDLNAVADAEQQSIWTLESIPEGSAAWQLKQNLINMPGGEDYQDFISKLHSYPPGIKQLLVESTAQGNIGVLDALLWKQAKGAFVLQPVQNSHSKIPDTAEYAIWIAKGKVTETDVYDYWSQSQKNEFLSDHGLNPDDYSGAGKNLKIAKILATMSNEQSATSSVDIANDLSNLKLSKIDKTYGGMHEKQGYADQFGREWMAKYYANDPNSNYRIDAEHYANVIGRMFGFNSALTFTDTIDGRANILQKIEDNLGNLTDQSVTDLNDRQLAAIASEHILDWVISNHDSHASNVLRTKDGLGIIGIDKGQAFKHLHDDKLANGYLPPENGESSFYDQIYNAIINHTISEKDANDIAYSVLSKAYTVQSRFDARYQELVTQALENRTFWPDELPTKADFIAALMQRKSTVLSDFEKFYKDTFAKAGYKLDVNTEDFGKTVGDAYIANNPQFAAAIKEAGAYGKALMFDSPDIEDHHLVATHVERADGGSNLNISLKLTADSDQRVTSYTKSLLGGDVTGAYGKNHDTVTVPSDLPYLSEFHGSIVNYAKTLSQHAPNGGKEPDGKYNDVTVSTAKQQAETAKGFISSLEDQFKTYPGEIISQTPSFPFKLGTMEQQEALYTALKKKLTEYEAVADAHNSNMSLKEYDPNIQPFMLEAYTPSKGLTHNSEAKFVSSYLLDDGRYVLTSSDGGHYIADDVQGTAKFWIPKSEYAFLVPSGKAVPVAPKDAPYWEGTDGTTITQLESGAWAVKPSNEPLYLLTHQEVTDMLDSYPADFYTFHGSTDEKSVLAQTQEKKLKVTYRKASGFTSKLNPSNGKMVEDTSLQHQENYLHTGNEYTVEHGNVKIHYRPWTEPGVARSQQGMMSIEVTGWDGSHNSIDDILDTLNILGVNVTPANAESLELGYYRQYTNIMKDRADTNTTLTNRIDHALAADPGMGTAAELALYKKIWSEEHPTIDTEGRHWIPQFRAHPGSTEVSGRPYWVRPDFSLAQLKDIYDDKLPTHQMMGASGSTDAMDRTYKILTSGRLLATEERLRILGTLVSGWSSDDDQSKGSSAFVFTRQNQSLYSVESDGPMFVIDPTAALQPTTYAYNTDHFGNIEYRKSEAYLEPHYMYDSGKHDSGNEMMIKNEAPIVAAVVSSYSQKEALITRLKKDGYTGAVLQHLVDMLFTEDEWQQQYKKVIDKIWKELLEKEKKFLKGIE